MPNLSDEQLRAVAVQGTTGDLVVAGSAVETSSAGKGKRGGGGTTSNVLAFVTRLDASGAVDVGFGSNGYSTHDVGEVHYGAIGIQSSGAIVVGSRLVDSAEGSGLTSWALHRYLADGSLDTAFGTVASPDSDDDLVLE